MPVFLLPSLAPLNGQSPPVALGDPTIALPYEGLVDLLTVDLVLEQLLPLHRAFLLGGFEIWAVQIGLSPETSAAGTAPTSWLRVDLATQQVIVTDDGAQLDTLWTPGTGLGVGLWLSSRRNEATGARLDFDLLEDVNVVDGDANLDELVTFFLFPLLLTLGPRPTNRGKLVKALADEVEYLTDFARVAMSNRFESATPTPDNASGLMWLFDPSTWSAAAPPAGLPGACLRESAAAIFTAIGDQVSDFFAGQISGEARLVDVLQLVYPRRRDARAQARKVVADILLLADTLGGLLDSAVRRELDRLPWFEVLLHLVHAGVIDPPALPDSFDFQDADDEEPVQARWTPATPTAPDGGRTTLELFVLFAAQTVVIERVHALDGVPVEQSFTWEFLQDAPGRPVLLVVAGPGVKITPPEKPPNGWALQIVRVQRFGSIPPWGERIDLARLLTPYPRAVPASIDADALLMFTPRADGLSIRQPGNTEDADFWQLDFTVDLYSPDHRITWSVEETNPPERRGAEEQLLGCELAMFVTPGVHVAYTSSLLYGNPSRGFQASDLNFYWGSPFGPGVVSLWEGSLAQLPSPGFVIKDSASGMTVRVPDQVNLLWQGFLFDAGAMAFDTVLGFIPIVGDVADGLELFSILVRGKDKYGRPAGALDFVLTAGGVVLPFVSAAFLRKLGREGLEIVEEGL